jgi:hypothetical protein
MSLIEFILDNSKMVPSDIIGKALSSGWNKSTLFAGLKEQGEALNDENGEYMVVKSYGRLEAKEKFDNWLEKRIDDMVKAL